MPARAWLLRPTLALLLLAAIPAAALAAGWPHDPAHADPIVVAPAYFKVSAYDRHGNEGPYATVLPGGTVGVDDAGAPRAMALGSASPNPALAATGVRVALPLAAFVRLAVYDPQGRRVRELVAGARPAGTFAVSWDGRDERGARSPAGLYFIRMEAEGRRFERRVVLLR